MANGLTMFPESYESFIEQYQTKEPKFGEMYVPAVKVRQALEHCISKQEHYCTNADILEKINESPYYYMALCQEVINTKMKDEIIDTIFGGIVNGI